MQESRTKYAILLMPISMLLLSLLRCGQFVSRHTDALSTVFRFKPALLTSEASNAVAGIAAAEVYTCEPHRYTVELLSIDPLVFYIDGFLRDVEIEHLLSLSYVPVLSGVRYPGLQGRPETKTHTPIFPHRKDNFQTAHVFAGSAGFQEVVNETMRRSQSTTLPKDDPVCRCLSARLQSLLGNVQHSEVEALQVVKYNAGGDHYRTHTDWFDAPKYDYLSSSPSSPSLDMGKDEEETSKMKNSRPSNRLASIFAYLTDCERGGETYFPHLRSVVDTADGEKYALTDGDTGLLVRPRRGSAIFWNNLHVSNGTGDERTAHAGLPVGEGTKIGLNIWSRYFLDRPLVGGD